jgi:hypothetical protein
MPRTAVFPANPPQFFIPAIRALFTGAFRGFGKWNELMLWLRPSIN